MPVGHIIRSEGTDIIAKEPVFVTKTGSFALCVCTLGSIQDTRL